MEASEEVVVAVSKTINLFLEAGERLQLHLTMDVGDLEVEAEDEVFFENVVVRGEAWLDCHTTILHL